jgi:putative ABC transport system permease protein
MRGVWNLSWLRLRRHPVQSGVLVLCIALTLYLPVVVRVLLADYRAHLMARAETTPLIMGARSNRFDLTFNALYFRQGALETLPYPQVQSLLDAGGVLAVPIHARFTAQGHPIVGTTLEYFEQRHLSLSAGTYPLLLGDVSLGAAVAAALNLNPGDSLFSDQIELYDIAVPPSLKMKVVGVLQPVGTPDDHAVFIDIKSSWILEGLAHGHDEVNAGLDPALILGANEHSVVLSRAMMEYNEVTLDNLASFHYHGDPDQLPLNAILCWPDDHKVGTLVKARVNQEGQFRMLAPTSVIQDLLAFVLRIRSLVDGVFGLLATITLLLTALVFLLSSRIRAREMRTLQRMGCSRNFVRALYCTEIGIVLSFAVLLAAATVALSSWLLVDLYPFLRSV